jgi:hypothetical protein
LKLKRFILVVSIFSVLTSALSAGQLLFDGFEGYNQGELDANDPSSPNSATINPTNFWAGYVPPNAIIVGAENSVNGVPVTPYSGTNMVRGTGNQGEFDQEFYNIGYLLNVSNNYSPVLGNVYVDWWFFDSVGPGTNGVSAQAYEDYLSLSYYEDFPTNQPYSSDLASSGPGGRDTDISIGGTSLSGSGFNGTNEMSGFDGTRYQAGDLTQTGYAPGVQNLPTKRSIGWHHARIEVSPPDTNAMDEVSLYLDDLTTPVLQYTSSYPAGFNTIVLNLDVSSVSAYFDDISVGTLVAVTPPSTLSIAASGTNAIITWNGNFILQSSPGLSPSHFTDVVNATTNFVTSPYTNAINRSTNLFFRLRN